ncbi:unnamed protein product [Didymodactylos carnosus]|uniref:COMM domain-containing protein n=1 Tax=Didymodactylos carnosus TaxID=1234261 RepID=A0A8S2DZR4_9BILA|nr:unnamed protein product [Didymodactylos carnosus]CAF3858332.1 unnamed protein product [Didymodactylos carnosus]
MVDEDTLTALSEQNFINLLCNILDKAFNRVSPTRLTVEPSTSTYYQTRLKLIQLLRSTNPSATSEAIHQLKEFNELPNNLQLVYEKFIKEYKFDIERYHLYQSSQHMEESYLKDFDWNIRIAMVDENYSKCRLPLLNLKLQLLEQNKPKNIYLELDETDLNRLITEMENIEQFQICNG